MRPDHNSDRSDGLIEVPARLVLRFGSITLAVVYAVGTGIGLAPIRISGSPRYAPSLITWWSTATYPVRGMTPRSAVG